MPSFTGKKLCGDERVKEKKKSKQFIKIFVLMLCCCVHFSHVRDHVNERRKNLLPQKLESFLWALIIKLCKVCHMSFHRKFLYEIKKSFSRCFDNVFVYCVFLQPLKMRRSILMFCTVFLVG